MSGLRDDAPCRECGHASAAHAGGGCRHCTCPAFSGAAGRRGYAASPREELLGFVTGVLSSAERKRFVAGVSRAHGLDTPTDAPELLVQLPHSTCASYLMELRRREREGAPLVR